MTDPCSRCEHCGLDFRRSVLSRILSAATVIIAVCALAAAAFAWWIDHNGRRL